MTDNHTIRLNTLSALDKARDALRVIGRRLEHDETDWILSLKRERTLKQNRKLSALIDEILEQRPFYHGVTMTRDSYRELFVRCLRKELRLVPDLDGTGMVPLGGSSSSLSLSEFSGLIDLVQAWCAKEGIELKEIDND
jgi:hypothetical protein